MSQQELLISLLDFLARNNIPYMLTGSVVSSLQGEPRLSHDIDVLVECDRRIVPSLQASFPAPRYYFDETAIDEAVQRGSMFNLLDTLAGDKIDFWMLTDSHFDECRFGRKIAISLLGRTAWISTPEDTILAKLRWAKQADGSPKQINDARRIFQVNESALDREYLRLWVLQLGVREQWEAMIKNI